MWRTSLLTVFALTVLACGMPASEGEPAASVAEARADRADSKSKKKGQSDQRPTHTDPPEADPSEASLPSGPAKDVLRRGELALGTDRLGEARSAMIHVPERANLERPQSAVIVLHGGKNNSARNIMDEWRNHLDRGFILLFPNGQRKDPSSGAWLAEGSDRTHVDVIGEARRVLLEDYNVAPDRLFVAGLSSGAHLTYQLSCLQPDWFAGYAVVNHYLKASTQSVCSSTGAPMLMMYGTDDESAGWGPRNDPNGKLHVIGAEATRAFFEDRNGCSPNGARTALPDRSGDRTQVFRQTYSCTKASLEYFEMEGGGHSWPGGSKKRAKNHCRDVDGADLILDFFRRVRGR